jgi:hypothetical protein
MAKTVASTLTTVLENPLVHQVMDRSQDVSKLIPQVKAYWGYDLFSRKPGPAVVDDEFKGTDLDLACFLFALVERNAVINLPVYKARRASSKTEGERVISASNRHGKIIGLTANREVFSFGIRVQDMNVVRTEKSGSETVGAPRNFMLVDVDGTWYDGWRCIEFSPSAKENDFLNDRKLWTGHTVIFKNFVHPNRWISFYGQYYFITKLLVERLELEAEHCAAEIKRLLAEGVKYPSVSEPKEYPKREKTGSEKKITVKAFEAEIDVPEFTGEFASAKNTPKALVEFTDRRRQLIYHDLPQLRFACRTVEYAFFKHGIENGVERLPAWVQDAKWERDFVQTGKKNKWNRLVLFQPEVGKFGVALRYRVKDKTERVAASSEE